MGLLVLSGLCATLFFFRRDLLWPKVRSPPSPLLPRPWRGRCLNRGPQALAVPILVLFVAEFRRSAHMGIRPSSLLAVSLLLHSAGDVIIKVVGVVPSMPAFLAGHLLYVACFLRGARVTSARFQRFSLAKRAILTAAVGYRCAHIAHGVRW